MGLKLLNFGFLFVLLSQNLFSQKPYEISLKADKEEEKISHDFKIDEVIDTREKKDIVGMVKKGLANRKRPAFLKGGFEIAIQTYLDHLFIRSASRSLKMKGKNDFL